MTKSKIKLRKGDVIKSFFGGWIQTTKKLPRTAEMVLVYFPMRKGSKIFMAQHYKDISEWVIYDAEENKAPMFNTYAVSHWRKLPNPPKNVL